MSGASTAIPNSTVLVEGRQVQQPTNVTTVLTNGINKYKPIVKTNVNNCSTKQVNALLKDNADIIPIDWKKWFAIQFYKLAPEDVIKFASQARADGREPAKLFNYLIRIHAKSPEL